MNRVVVVEDSILLRKGLILTTEWDKVGCEVVGEAENGLDGVETILRLSPDIVIADIKMPGLDGIQMIKELKGKTDALFIIMSGYSEFEYARNALKLGVVDYLMKPIEDRELINTIKSACETIRKRKNISKIQDRIDKMDDSRIMLFKEYLIGSDSTKTTYVDEAVSYICQNFKKDINVRDISNKLLISESHLSRIFKDETGYTIGDYLTNYRIKQACKLLLDPSVKIYEIADKIGYKDQRYFSVIFKKLVGVTPTEFKDKLNKDQHQC